MPHIALLIDNFTGGLQISSQLENILREGGSYGIYVIATCGTVSGLGYKLQQNVKTKIALQMTDNADYVSIVGRTGGILPKNVVGRGLYRDGKVMEFQTALPTSSIDEKKRSELIKDIAAQQKQDTVNVIVKKLEGTA